MNCPCGNRKIEPDELRRWMASNQEARMAARAVAKADTFGGDLTPCEVDGRRGVWVGPQPEVAVCDAEVSGLDAFRAHLERARAAWLRWPAWKKNVWGTPKAVGGVEPTKPWPRS